MARSETKLFRLVGAAYSALFSLVTSVVTVVLVDTIIASGVFLWRFLGLNHGSLVKFCSAVLRLWFSIFMGHFEHFGRITIELTGDSFFSQEAALVVCNHRSWADTIVVYSLARQVRMHGDVKFLAKRSLLGFPIFGFAGWILDVVIFIKRQSSSAGLRMVRMFDSLTDPRRERLPYWLINYLEGTRFTEAKRRAAVEFAATRDLKPLDHVLQPRTKGFISTVHALRGNAQAVYDITIGYQESDEREMKPSFKEMYFIPSLKDRVIHVHQRRIPLEDVPRDDEELRKWVYTLYEQKDDLLRHFHQTGKFPGRHMRWNRMTWGYWLKCQAAIFGSFWAFVVVTYKASRLVR